MLSARPRVDDTSRSWAPARAAACLLCALLPLLRAPNFKFSMRLLLQLDRYVELTFLLRCRIALLSFQGSDCSFPQNAAEADKRICRFRGWDSGGRALPATNFGGLSTFFFDLLDENGTTNMDGFFNPCTTVGATGPLPTRFFTFHHRVTHTIDWAEERMTLRDEEREARKR